jgi:endonuclease YncB( thermonuclease family)
MKKTYLNLFLFLLLLPSPALAATGYVLRVHDGDTLTLQDGRRSVRVRLYGIDAPELAQEPYGPWAGRYAAWLVLGRQVDYFPQDRDRYGRVVAIVVRRPDGLNVNEALLYNGCAWHYRRYDHSARFAALEADARRAHRGLWAEAHPLPPWQYRQMHRNRRRPRR